MGVAPCIGHVDAPSTPVLRRRIAATVTRLSRPALCVPRDFGVYLARDLHQLRRSRGQLFGRYHQFEGVRLYDADGRAFEVTAASVSRPVSKCGRALARLLDLTITVDVEMAPIGSASLPDVISAVQSAMEADPESCEELSGRGIEWWHATLAHTLSMQGVMRAFDDPQRDGSRRV